MFYVAKQMLIRLELVGAPLDDLLRLQEVFSQACTEVAAIAARNRCWNRVALHHLTYRQLRERFPALGSQMACNVIYSVSSIARWVYQHPGSPWCATRRPEAPLPLFRFSAMAPVYFDRHTLSVRNGVVSMFTLGGRIRVLTGVSFDDEQRFRQEKIKEIVLSRDDKGFYLLFVFGEGVLTRLECKEMPQYLAIPE